MENNDNSQEILNLIQNIQSKLQVENSENNTDNNPVNIDNPTNNSNTVENKSNNFDISSILNLLTNNSNNTSSSAPTNMPNFDLSSLGKFQKMFSSFNQDDPKKSLLLSLKPFLRKTRQDKIGEYITMLTIAEAIGIFNKKGSD